jgi:hypothetical protein
MKTLFLILFKQLICAADLVCSDNLLLNENAFPCGDAKFGYPQAFFFAKPGQVITAVGTTPTPTEVGTAMALSTAAKVVALNPVTEGALTVEGMEVQGPDDLAELINTKIVINAVIRHLNDSVIDDLRQFVINKRVQFWFVDNFGRWYGGTTGFRAAIICPTFPAKENGNATKAGIAIRIEFWHDESKTWLTAVNTAYLDLDNA